jgi:hypothetical protein
MNRCPDCLEEVHVIGDEYAGYYEAGHNSDCPRNPDNQDGK